MPRSIFAGLAGASEEFAVKHRERFHEHALTNLAMIGPSGLNVIVVDTEMQSACIGLTCGDGVTFHA